jgi:hypothetical protein
VTAVKAFAIPVALDPDDVPTPPARADKSNAYRCPGCQSLVVLRRRSARNRAHLAHGAGTCSRESILHITAKLVIARVVLAWRAGGPAPQFVRRCPRCRDGHHLQALPAAASVHAVVPEHRLETGIVPDVVLLDADARPIAAIEILATHRVDEQEIPRMSIPWVELLASHVAENPLLWIPLQDHLNPFRQCAACNACDAELAARFDEHGYIAKPFACYKCAAAMTVYMWRGKSLWEDQPPPDPMPPTVQYRYSRTAEARYWANVCPLCNAVQSRAIGFSGTPTARSSAISPIRIWNGAALATRTGFRLLRDGPCGRRSNSCAR